MGPMSQVLGMIPGFRGVAKLKDAGVDERQLDRVEAIIRSMTPGERRRPETSNGSLFQAFGDQMSGGGNTNTAAKTKKARKKKSGT